MKTLCDYDKKEIENSFKKLVKNIKEPKFVCNKCLRAANDKKLLCKPVEIS